MNTKIDSQKYVRPAVAYFQELVTLASERGFIMSHINANELSNKLSSTLNKDLIEPLLKVSFAEAKYYLEFRSHHYFYLFRFIALSNGALRDRNVRLTSSASSMKEITKCLSQCDRDSRKLPAIQPPGSSATRSAQTSGLFTLLLAKANVAS